MLPSLRHLALVMLGAATLGGGAWAADEALPPEPANGEWIEDTLDDASLWFASSGNLGFESVARELHDYPRGRRWVRVVNGKPAWVMYYVPSELLGFEIDTHHFAASATGFRFAAGATWNSLTAVEADFEEIVAFDAKWLRLYRATNQLPPGMHFLKIEFPPDAEVDAARLSEVWLRCRRENPAGGSATPLAAPLSGKTSADAIPVPPGDELIAPYVVRGIILPPPALPGLARPVIDVAPVRPVIAPVVPESLANWAGESLRKDILARTVVASAPVPPPPRPSVFSRVMMFLYLRGPRP